MPVVETNWAEIRRAYEDGPETVANLAARYAVSVRRIYSRAKAEDWLRRASQEPKSSKGRKAERPSAAERQETGIPKAQGRPRRVTRKAMIARLYRAIDDKLKQLEARMSSGSEISAAESERETRELGVMIRSFEKVTEFATEIENRRKTAAPERISAGEAERMRNEIAERLERLNGQGNSSAGSGEVK